MKKGCLTVIGVFAIIFVILIIGVGVGVNSMKEHPEQNQKKTELASVMELNEEQEVAIQKIFDECAIGEVTKIEKSGSSSFRIRNAETEKYAGMENNVTVILNDKTVSEIYLNKKDGTDYDIYVDGEIKAKITDYYVPEEYIEQYRVNVEMLVKEVSKHPDTVKFPSRSKWQSDVIDGKDVVQVQFTAKNDLNSEITSTVRASFSRGAKVPDSLIIDGKEYK